MTAQLNETELDRAFDDGEDVLEFFDLEHPVFMIGGREVSRDEYRAMCEPKQIRIDPPAWVVSVMDSEAERTGVPRKSVINSWLATMATNVQRERAAAKA